jgi:hypothetical protein
VDRGSRGHCLSVPAAPSLQSDECAAKLRANGDEAIAAKVFGVPSLVIDGRVFWGQDATEMAMDFLLHREHFETAEMRRVVTLPVGVTRT